jgi:hypothetical protein
VPEGGAAVKAFARTCLALLVAFVCYFFAFAFFNFIRHYPGQGRVLGTLVAIMGGYLAGVIAGRTRRPVLHAAAPASFFFLAGAARCLATGSLEIAIETVVLTGGALLGGILAAKRTPAQGNPAAVPPSDV